MVPAVAVGAPDDLGARFSHILDKLGGRAVSADALFETLRLEVLDWSLDNGIEAQPPAEAEAAAAGEERG